VSRRKSGARRKKPGWWFLAKGAAVAICYGITTLVVAGVLTRLDVREDSAAVAGGMAGLVAAAGLLWWFKSRGRDAGGQSLKSDPT